MIQFIEQKEQLCFCSVHFLLHWRGHGSSGVYICLFHELGIKKNYLSINGVKNPNNLYLNCMHIGLRFLYVHLIIYCDHQIG